jgi:Protein of unknown function (DUF2934)
MSKPTEEQIRKRAQEIWEENHRPTGRDDEFWFRAEKELKRRACPGAYDSARIGSSPIFRQTNGKEPA